MKRQMGLRDASPASASSAVMRSAFAIAGAAVLKPLLKHRHPNSHDGPMRSAREEKPVTADTALRLGKFFKTGAAFWMSIQASFDLEAAENVLARRSRRSRPTRDGALNQAD